MRRLLIISLVLIGTFAMVTMTHAQPAAQPTAQQQVQEILAEIKRRAILKFNATTTQDAIDTAQYELQRISNLNVAAAISENAVNKLIDAQLSKNITGLKAAKLTLKDQSVQGVLDYVGTLSAGALGFFDAKAQLQVQVALVIELRADTSPIEFRVGFAVRDLEIQNLAVSRGGQPVPGLINELAGSIINTLLIPLQATLNRTELRLPTAMSARIELKPKKEPGLEIEFDRKELSAKLVVASISHLVDQRALIVVAQLGGPLASVAARPKNVKFQDFRVEFERRLATSGATWMRQDDLAAYVDRRLIQQLASQMLGAGPVCMTGKMTNLPIPFDTRLRLPPVESIDCTPTRDCRDKRECAQRQDCSQSANCHRCLVSVFGRCKLRGNDPGCEAGKVARKATCEAQKPVLKAKCEAEKEAANKLCELKKVADKASCEGYKEAYKRWRQAGPNFGNVESSDFRLSGTARACLTNVSLDEKELRLKAKLSIESKAHADGRIKFTPLNVTGHMLCFGPYQKGINGDAEVPAQPIEIDTLAQYTDGATQTTIQASFSNKIRAVFPFRSILLKLATDPAFTMTCPILQTGILLRLATPDDWWPQAARGNIERDLPAFNIELDLVRKPARAGDFQLVGKLRRTPAAIGGTFRLAKKAA